MKMINAFSYYTNNVDVKERLATYYRLLANVLPKTELQCWQVSGCGDGYMFDVRCTLGVQDLVNFYISTIYAKGE